MSTYHKRMILEELRDLLYGVCHDPQCTNLKRTCPNQCRCRYGRTFQLNNETAICWELAGMIARRFEYTNPVVTQKMIKQAQIYEELSYYHMSSGWGNFFMHVRQILRALKHGQMPYALERSDQLLKEMKRAIPYLKRDRKVRR